MDTPSKLLIADAAALTHRAVMCACMTVQDLKKLATLPAMFFSGQSQLVNMLFEGATTLGAEEPLPNDLLKGLTSLTQFTVAKSGIQKLPNMDDLVSLVSLSIFTNQLHMNDQESDSMFDGIVAAEDVMLDTNLLTRVPAIKYLGKLVSLSLNSNKITAIFNSDFKGAHQLVYLGLSGNCITSAASEAFANLAMFRVKPAEFNPTQSDGTPFRDGLGLGLWQHTGLGYFGGGQEWANVPISFSPNPAQCAWVGPLVSDVDCSQCVGGYETTSDENVTCTMPSFRPRRGWSPTRAAFQLHDARGVTVKNGTTTNCPTLLIGHTYSIPAPSVLKNEKEKMYVGYTQPYSRIRYELDFSRGATVDIGCGTLTP